MSKNIKKYWSTPNLTQLKVNLTKDNKHKSSTEAAGEKNAILVS